MFTNHSKHADKQYVEGLKGILLFYDDSLNGVTRGVLATEYLYTELLTTQIGLIIFSVLSLIEYY